MDNLKEQRRVLNDKSPNSHLKYIYRSICSIIFTVLASGSFAFVWFEFVKVNNQTGHLTGYGNLMMALLLYIALFVETSKWLHAFKIGVERRAKVMAGVVLAVFFTNLLEVFLSMAVTGQFRFFFRFVEIYGLLFIVQSVVLSLLVIPMVNLYRKIIPPLRVIEITGDHLNKLTQKVNAIEYKYHIDNQISYQADESIILEEIKDYDAVLINDVPAHYENKILKICFDIDKRVYLVPKLSDIIVKSSDELNLLDTPLFLCRNLGIKPWKRFVKRFLDILLSGIALVILSPVFLITALAIKLEDHGPVFFRQERVTINGKRFMILKFRSMIVDAEKDGRPHPAGEKDDRITKVGNVIRSCRIDELPQLINILAGDMSIVGPRPERWEHVEKYTKEIPEFSYRQKVKGGLTGYAQVYGKYNTSALDKLKLDMIYITNYSLVLDFQIIFETVKILFQRESTEGFDEETAMEIHRAGEPN